MQAINKYAKTNKMPELKGAKLERAKNQVSEQKPFNPVEIQSREAAKHSGDHIHDNPPAKEYATPAGHGQGPRFFRHFDYVDNDEVNEV